MLFRDGKVEEANTAKTHTSVLKAQETELKAEVETLEATITGLMYQLPNVPNELVKPGKSEVENEILEEIGSQQTFDFTPHPHWELAETYDLIDFELGVKITGGRIPRL